MVASSFYFRIRQLNLCISVSLQLNPEDTSGGGPLILWSSGECISLHSQPGRAPQTPESIISNVLVIHFVWLRLRLTQMMRMAVPLPGRREKAMSSPQHKTDQAIKWSWLFKADWNNSSCTRSRHGKEADCTTCSPICLKPQPAQQQGQFTGHAHSAVLVMVPEYPGAQV